MKFASCPRLVRAFAYQHAPCARRAQGGINKGVLAPPGDRARHIRRPCGPRWPGARPILHACAERARCGKAECWRAMQPVDACSEPMQPEPPAALHCLCCRRLRTGCLGCSSRWGAQQRAALCAQDGCAGVPRHPRRNGRA